MLDAPTFVSPLAAEPPAQQFDLACALERGKKTYRMRVSIDLAAKRWRFAGASADEAIHSTAEGRWVLRERREETGPLRAPSVRYWVDRGAGELRMTFGSKDGYVRGDVAYACEYAPITPVRPM